MRIEIRQSPGRYRERLSRARILGRRLSRRMARYSRRPEMTVADLLKVRSDAIQDGNALARAGAPDEVEGMYRGLASDVDELVEQQANQIGVTQQWRRANAGWRDYQAKFNTPSSPLYRIANQADPAKLRVRW